MATTKSTKRSEDIHGEKTSMFRRMITKLKNVPAEDDLEVVNKIKPTERVSTEPSIREVKECTTGALQEDLQDLQNVEKRSMFRRMINKLKKGTAEDDLDDGSETNLKPSQRGSTEPSIRELMECTGALRENLQDLQERLQEQTEENHRQENEVLREKTEAESKIRELEKRLSDQAASTRHRISLKDEEILALKARVLEFEKKGFDETKTPVRSQTLQGKNVLIDPTSIMQDIQKIREENEKRTARQQEVIRKMRQQDLTQQIGPQEKVLKDIKVKSSEYNPSPQCANERAVEKVTNRSVPTLLSMVALCLDADQPNQTKKKEPAAALPTLLLNGCPLLLDDDQDNQAKKKEPAAAPPTLLLNGCPLLLDDDQHNQAMKKKPAAAPPTLLLNGCPLLLDDDQHNQEKKKKPAAAPPTLLLNGCPLLDDDQHNQAMKKKPAAALPTLLLNGCPLLDNDQDNQAEKKEPAAAPPTLLLNGCPLLDDDQHNGAKEETCSRSAHTAAQCQASGDSNIKEPPLLPDIELPRFPGFCGVQSFPRSPVEHGDHQHSSVDPAHFLLHPIPLNSFIEQFLLSQRRSASPTEEKECGLGDFYHETSQSASTPEQTSSPRGAHSKLNHDAMVLRQSPSIRLRASLESLSTVDFGGGDMKPAPTVAPCRKQEKPHKYREFQQNMSHLDFPALDEPRGLEVLIERKVPQQVWTAPDVVRDGPRGLEIALEESATKEHFHSVQYNVLQRCELNGMFGKASISNMAAAPCQGKSHKSPAAEGDDVTVPHNPASFPLALLTSRIKKGYRLTTGFC
uniref:Uncharacterized protein n=1 Tax=Branchiostoma floridae TaxID=7739 RepID=C3ZIT6_BRAFL|eukprot:XP_002591526.1 hypothetical protein BRAFLDRAFT_105200 [Branchiostoma floridae]